MLDAVEEGHTVSQHSVLSPSGADRIFTCLGALAAGKHLPRSPDNPASLLGSAKHAISELVLREPNGQIIDAMVGQTWHLSKGTKELERTRSEGCYTFEIDDEFADHCRVYIDYVNSRPGTKAYEVLLDCAHIYGVAGQSGTADCVHRDYVAREVEIVDAKMGYIPVGAQHKQLRIYGAAALTLYDLEGDWDTVRCTIVQPQDFAEQIKSHVYTRAEIEAFIEYIRPLAKQAYDLYMYPESFGPLSKWLTPGPVQCAWCPVAERGCIARNERIVNMFEDNTKANPDVVLMTDAQLGELYPLLPDVAEWVKSIAAEAERRAFMGTTIPDNKLIYGKKGNRKWIEGQEEAVQNTLSVALGEAEMFQPRKLLSPTGVEDALAKAKAKGIYDSVKVFVTQNPARLKLVPNSAKGDPVTVAPVHFDEVSV